MEFIQQGCLWPCQFRKLRSVNSYYKNQYLRFQASDYHVGTVIQIGDLQGSKNRLHKKSNRCCYAMLEEVSIFSLKH